MNCNPVSVCCSSQGCAYLGTSWGLPAACTQLYEESPWGCVTMLCLAGCPWCPYCPQCPVRWCVLWWIVSRQSDKDTVTRWHCTVCILARYTDVYIVNSGARYVCIRTDRGTWSRWRGVPRLAAVLRAVSGVTKWLEVLATDCYHQTGAGLIDSKQTSQHFLNAPHTCGCKCITWYNLRILRLTYCIYLIFVCCFRFIGFHHHREGPFLLVGSSCHIIYHMTFALTSKFHVYLSCLSACLA